MAAALATTMIPANATAGAGAFEGTASIGCFGCGTSTGTADLCVTGVEVNAGPVIIGPAVCVTGIPVVGTPNVHADYTVAEGTGVGCVVSGTATGTFTGALNGNFTWTRVGA